VMQYGAGRWRLLVVLAAKLLSDPILTIRAARHL
jgi:hypothetical protein